MRSVPEAEKRLGMFASEVVKRGLGDRRTLKSAKSREALETFLNLNVHILDLKKVSFSILGTSGKSNRLCSLN